LGCLINAKFLFDKWLGLCLKIGLISV